MCMGILNKAFSKSFGKMGQLQIQETILTVFIFIVLIMFGLIFFYRVQSASITDSFNEFQREKLSVDFITLGDLPEFSCSAAGTKESCIDTAKLVVFMSLNSTQENRDYYFDRFGYKNITIREVYPSNDSDKCTINMVSDCGVWEIYTKKPNKVKSKLVIDTPVSLFFPVENKYGIGIMRVEAYNV